MNKLGLLIKLVIKSYDKIVVGLIVMVIILVFLRIIQSGGMDGIGDFYKHLDEMELENEKYRDLGENPQVRVVIMTDSFASIYHASTKLEGENLEILYGQDWKESKTVREIELEPGHELFQEGSVKVRVSNNQTIGIKSIERNYGNPQYQGEFEIFATDKGLVLVNELPLELYLRRVVPSEMPASYHLEALKAQAVCARSYAYMQMQKISYQDYDAHMNDSVSYQVYNNLNTSDKTDQAIEETAGQKVGIDGKVVTTYFYSTSSGHTTDLRAWGKGNNDSNSYLQGVPVSNGSEDYEKDLPWYSWEIEVSKDTMQEIIELNIQESIGKLKDIAILSKGAGDVALSMKITGQDGSVTVEGENSIRKTLGGNNYNIIKNDGKSTKGMDLLPSAFFSIEQTQESYTIKGGGLGHGIGMSQNGANEMAKAGIGYKEIIDTFYQNVELIY